MRIPGHGILLIADLRRRVEPQVATVPRSTSRRGGTGALRSASSCRSAHAGHRLCGSSTAGRADLDPEERADDEVPAVAGCVPVARMGAGDPAAVPMAHADEGMWVFNNLPLAQLKARYGFEPPAGWADHLRSSAVRFNSGGSGSFVSADGLVMTNHHVGADTLAKLSTPEKDYYHDGFLARRYEDEVKAPDLELNVLVAIEDVTERVNRGGQARHGRRRGRRGPPPGHGPDREGIDRQERAPQRRRHALPGRAVPSLHLQEIHRRPAGLRPRVRHRLLRRRSGQLRVSPLRPRRLLLPGLRGRQAGEDRALPEVEPRRVEGRRAGLRRRPSRAGPTGSIRSPASSISATSASRSCSTILKTKEAFLLDYGRTQRRGGPPVEGRPLQRPEQPQGARRRPGGAARRGVHEAQSRRPRPSSAAGSRPTAKPDEPRDARLGPDRRGAEDRPRGSSSRYILPRARLGLRLARSSRSPATWSGWPRRSTKPNAERLKEYRDRRSSRSSWSCSPTAPIYPEFEEAKLAHSLAEWKKRDARRSAGRTRAPRPLARGGRRASSSTGTKLADVEVRAELAEGGHGGDRGLATTR